MDWCTVWVMAPVLLCDISPNSGSRPQTAPHYPLSTWPQRAKVSHPKNFPVLKRFRNWQMGLRSYCLPRQTRGPAAGWPVPCAHRSGQMDVWPNTAQIMCVLAPAHAGGAYTSRTRRCRCTCGRSRISQGAAHLQGCQGEGGGKGGLSYWLADLAVETAQAAACWQVGQLARHMGWQHARMRQCLSNTVGEMGATMQLMSLCTASRQASMQAGEGQAGRLTHRLAGVGQGGRKAGAVLTDRREGRCCSGWRAGKSRSGSLPARRTWWAGLMSWPGGLDKQRAGAGQQCPGSMAAWLAWWAG